jgi:hypothetical protein
LLLCLIAVKDWAKPLSDHVDPYHLIIKRDLQLVMNFSNKSYTPKDEHMSAYLEERRKMEKHF